MKGQLIVVDENGGWSWEIRFEDFYMKSTYLYSEDEAAARGREIVERFGIELEGGR